MSTQAQTLEVASTTLAGTAYTALFTADETTDALVSAVSVYNATGGNVTPTLSIATSTPADAAKTIHAYGTVATVSTAQLPAGFEILVPAWYTLYGKSVSTVSFVVQARKVYKGEKI